MADDVLQMLCKATTGAAVALVPAYAGPSASRAWSAGRSLHAFSRPSLWRGWAPAGRRTRCAKRRSRLPGPNSGHETMSATVLAAGSARQAGRHLKQAASTSLFLWRLSGWTGTVLATTDRLHAGQTLGNYGASHFVLSRHGGKNDILTRSNTRWMSWRKAANKQNGGEGGDSNPRYPQGHNGFRGPPRSTTPAPSPLRFWRVASGSGCVTRHRRGSQAQATVFPVDQPKLV